MRDEWTSAFLAAYGLVQLCDALLWLDAESMPAFARNRLRTTLCTSTNDIVTGVGLPVVLTNVAFTQIEHGLSALLCYYGKALPAWTRHVKTAFVVSAPWRFYRYWGAPPY